MTTSPMFMDVSGAEPREQDPWESVVIPKETIEAEIERLASIPRPANGRRASLIRHPKSTAPGFGLAPGIDVTISVLKPGESVDPIRRNSTQLDMCLRGEGAVSVAGREFGIGWRDVWNTPSMQVQSARNTGRDLFVRLTYSNAPLLEKLEVHYVEENPPVKAIEDRAGAIKRQSSARRAREMAENIALGEDGARLLGYEYLIDIDVIESKALIWRWLEVQKHLPQIKAIGRGYSGRRLYVLYNPATERRNGTTHSFFATISSRPLEVVDAPHRHSSAAINYYLLGHGWSKVNGRHLEWKAGDLMLSAPGWAIHGHASKEESISSMTVQDHPLHIAMESLIWQETLEGPVLALGSEAGFESNRAQLEGA